MSYFCEKTLRTASRREFLEKSGLGFGALAAGLMLGENAQAAPVTNPFAPKAPHFPAKGKSVIFLFMHGGPSHLDTFDPKPLLNKLDGKPIPPSFGKVDFQFSNMDKTPLMGTPRVFKKRGQSGLEISDLFENVAQHADDLAVIRSCHHDGFTHVTGQTWMNTGWGRIGRPSVGSWVVYGLGNESENLPAYVVMLDGGIKAGAPAYGSGFLPAAYQGTTLRSEGAPILNVNRPEGISATQQREMFDLLNTYNEQHRVPRSDDSELAARMASYELAFKMQMSVPEVADLKSESDATRKLYGLDDPMSAEFGTQCLMARRLVEKGVRFVQLYSGGRKGAEVGWDGHNECDQNHQFMARKVDKPIAGLLADLKSRGLLDSTVVLWGGDFGRTPFTDGAEGGGGNRNGRDHNPYGFSVWMAGGGIKGGKAIGATDEIGLKATEDKVTMHDLHGTLLGLLGVDHKRLTYFFQGREFRLTDVGGENNLVARLTRA
ncbi:MAG: DUF1501 domain-containing protein [Acidobacteria bacterium]|nr:DUF1501 domain-containing protein [Acidobacteriota bacterium]